MSYDPRAIANWFIDRAALDDETLSPMKLQKLVYVAHGWSLGLTGKPLVYEPVEAWKWGPVFRSIYREFREFGSGSIDRHATVLDGSTLVEREIKIDDYPSGGAREAENLLEKIWDVYGQYTASDLSNMTHRTGTPWHDMFTAMGNQILPYTVISSSKIEEHYKELAK